MHKEETVNMRLNIYYLFGTLTMSWRQDLTWKGKKRSDDKLAQQTDESLGAWCKKVTDELRNVKRGFNEGYEVNEADQVCYLSDSTVYSTRYIIPDGWNTWLSLIITKKLTKVKMNSDSGFYI